MAKFQYRMQNILNLKLKLEDQAKITYGLANQRYLEQQEILNDMLLRRMGYENELKQLMRGSLDMKLIKEKRDACESLKILIRRQMMEVHKAELELDAARNALLEVRKERMMHEKLKEKALENFKKELLAEESKEIDQLVSYTYNN